jgi:hypothetical protein
MDARAIVEAKVVEYFAGNAAWRNALRGAPGWVRMRSWDELVAHHEAAHCVVGWAVGRHPWAVSVVPDEHAAGVAWISSQPTPPADWKKERTNPGNDIHHATKLCFALTPNATWKSILVTARKLRSRAEQLVELYWFQIDALAYELERRREMNHEEISKFLRA